MTTPITNTVVTLNVAEADLAAMHAAELPTYPISTDRFHHTLNPYNFVQMSLSEFFRLYDGATIDTDSALWLQEIVSQAPDEIGTTTILSRETHNSRFFKIDIVVA